MKKCLLLIVFIVFPLTSIADDETTEAASEAEALVDAAEERELTGAEKKELEDRIVESVVEEHNLSVEDDMDEVICKKERVTGSRRTIRVCKTRREIEEEKAASQRLMRERTRRGSSPTVGGSQGAN